MPITTTDPKTGNKYIWKSGEWTPMGETDIQEDRSPVSNSPFQITDNSGNKFNWDSELKSWEPVESKKDNLLVRGLKDIASGGVTVVEGMLGAAEWVSGSETVAKMHDTVKNFREDLMPEDPTYLDKFLSAGGSAISFFIPGFGIARSASVIAKFGPTMAKMFGAGASAVLESGTEAGFAYKEALAEGAPEWEANTRASKVFAMNAVLNTVTNKLGIFGESGNRLRRTIIGAFIEGGQEMTQDDIQALAANKPMPSLGDRAETFTIGAILGGGMTSIFSQDSPDRKVNNALKKGDISTEDVEKVLEDKKLPKDHREAFEKGLEDYKKSPQFAEQEKRKANLPPSPETVQSPEIRTVPQGTYEIDEKPPESVEEELDREQAKYDRLNQSPAEEAEVAPEEPIVEPSTDKQKLEAKAKEVNWRKKTVKDIRELSSKNELSEIIKNYESLPENELKKNDKARLREAKNSLRLLEQMEKESNDFVQGMEQSARMPVQPGTRDLKAVYPTLNNPNPDKIFVRSGEFKDSASKPVKTRDRAVRKTVSRINEIEKQIAEGNWEFQEVFDRALELSPNLTIRLTHPGKDNWKSRHDKSRGQAHVGYNPNTGEVYDQTLFLSIKNIAAWDFIGKTPDSVIVHELLHTIHQNAIGPTAESSPKKQEYFNEIIDVFNSIPTKNLAEFKKLANEFETAADVGIEASGFFKLSKEQQNRRRAWFDIFNNLKEDNINVEEVATYIFSEPQVMFDLYQIKTQTGGKGGAKDSLGARLVKAFLKFVNTKLTKPFSRSVMDDLLDVHYKYTAQAVAAKNVQAMDTIIDSIVEESVTRKKLSDKDKALLKWRSENLRKGKTQREHQEATKRERDADRIAAKRATNPENPDVKLRYTIEKAGEGLVTKDDLSLEDEIEKVKASLEKSKLYGSAKGRKEFLEERLKQAEVISARRATRRLEEQKEIQAELADQAGDTLKSNIRTYKRLYKKFKRLNAPFRTVDHLRSELIDLMGPDKFASWSGEKITAVETKTETAPKKVKAEKPKKKIVRSYKDEQGRTINVYEKGEAADIAESSRETFKDNEQDKAKYDEILNNIDEVYYGENPKELSNDVAVELFNSFNALYEKGVIDQDELQAASDKILGAVSTEDNSYGTTEEYSRTPDANPQQMKLNKVAPVDCKFDAYLSPNDGYVGGGGYQFTIMDPNHPAYRGTFNVSELTKEAMAKKFKEIEKLWGTKASVTDDDVTWKTINNMPGYYEERTEFDDDTAMNIRMKTELKYGKWQYEPVTEMGTPVMEILWSYETDTSTDAMNDRFSRTEGVVDRTKGMTVIRRIQNILTSILIQDSTNIKIGEPGAVYFSADDYDTKKMTAYENFAKRLARKLTWDFKPGPEKGQYYVINPNFEVTQQMIDKAKETRDNLGITSQMEADEAPMYLDEEESNFNGDFEEAFLDILGETKDDIEVMDLPAGKAYKHHDGGLYDSFTIVKTKDKGFQVFGHHTMYDENYELFSVDPETLKTEGFNKWDYNYVVDNFLDDIIDHDGPALAESRSDSSSGPVEMHVAEDPNVESNMATGELGKKPDSLWTKTKDLLNNFREQTREFEKLKRKEYGDVQLMLRNLKKGRGDSARKAIDTLNGILKGLDKSRYHNLQRYAYLMDLSEQVYRNEAKRRAGEDPETTANPYGWTDMQILKECRAVQKLVNQDTDTYNAWQARKHAWFEIRRAYIQAMKNVGMNMDNRLNRAYYFRHQVLDLMQAERQRLRMKGGGKLAVPTRRSHLRARRASSPYAMNLNYLQAEFEIMAQLIYDTQIANTLDTIMKVHGERQPREGYVPYQPREDSIFYMAHTIPSRMLQSAVRQGLTDLNVDLTQLDKVLAVGGKYKGYYLPKNLAETLNTALENRPSNFITRAAKGAMTKWKMWQLLSPLRAFKYNVRNMTGDAEAVFLGSPGVFLHVPSALKELATWKKTGTPSADLKSWIEAGGEASTLQAQEITDIPTLPQFTKQTGLKASSFTPKALVQKWFNAVRMPTDMREMMLRYAAYKKFLNEIKGNNGRPKDYVASMPEEINAMQSVEDKAFTMANDLLGAYDRVSVGGQTIRSYLAPFWSFQEVNMKRTVQMFRNAVHNDRLTAQVGRALGAKTIVASIKVGRLGIKLLIFSSILQAWNNMMFPDEERALPEEMRDRSHIIVGVTKGKQPQILYFPRLGVVGDLLEWAGIDSAPSDIYKIATGQKSIKDVIEDYDYGKENFKSVVNKVVQSAGPQYKIPFELTTGEKLFPSVFNRQPITDNVRYLAENLSLAGVYDGFTGRPTKASHWTDMAAKVFVYKDDKRRFGWLATRQAIEKYKKEKGLKGTGFIVTESGNALYNLGLAWRYGDKKAVNKYLYEYTKATINKLGKVDIVKTMNRQWEKLDPLDGLPEVHKKLFLLSLDEQGQYAFGLAMAYYQEIKAGTQFVKGK